MSLVTRLMGLFLIFSAIMYWQKGGEMVVTFWTSAVTGFVVLVLATCFVMFVLWAFGIIELSQSRGAICTIGAIIVGIFGLDDAYVILDKSISSMLLTDIFFYAFAALVAVLLLEHLVRHREDIKEYARERRG